MKYVIIAAMSLTLAACGSTDSNQLADGESNKDDIGYQCEKVYKTGSTIPTKMCTTKAQRKKQEEDLKEFKNNTKKPVITCQIQNCGA